MVSETGLSTLRKWASDINLTRVQNGFKRLVSLVLENGFVRLVSQGPKKRCLRLVSLHLQNGPVILISQGFKMGLRD